MTKRPPQRPAPLSDVSETMLRAAVREELTDTWLYVHELNARSINGLRRRGLVKAPIIGGNGTRTWLATVRGARWVAEQDRWNAFVIGGK